MPNTHEQKFLNALRDIFVGARIEGESGYINLMRIKSRYYTEGVFPKLMEAVDTELAPFPTFREELFDKLYSFFKRYFSDSGSIYFRHTPYYQDIYERIYTDDRDVMLFWKTQNLYYVKTDRLFRSLTLNLDDAPDQKYAFDASAVEKQSFNFDASGLQNKRNNEKRSLIFEYKGKSDDGTLKFAVQYTESGKKTKTDDILKAIKRDGVAVSEINLARAFRLFERQSEVDFFINKNAKAFLEEQFDLWLYQYLFKRESDWTDKRIRELQALKRVARRIIEFIAQFEDELVRIWNKPKFARASNYVITFDRVFARKPEVARKMLAHENIEAQIAEWRELGMVDEQFTIESIFRKDEEAAPKSKKKRVKQTEALTFETDAGATESEAVEVADALPELSAKYRYLPFDTKHFKSLELEILSLFDDLDGELDGRLINSENYQALNTLKDKFREKVKCIYIDPPYNTDSTPIDYKNGYKNSSWLSLMEGRISLAPYFLSDNGVIAVAIDDAQQRELNFLLTSHFGGELLGIVVLRSNPSGRPTQAGFSVSHEYVLFAGMEKATIGKLQPTDKQIARFSEEDEMGKFEWRNLRREGSNSDRQARKFLHYPIFVTESSFRVPKMNWNEEKEEWKTIEKPRGDEHILYPIDDDGNEKTWRWGFDKVIEASDQITVKTNKAGKNQLYYKRRANEAGVVAVTMWFDAKYSATEHGTALLKDLFGLSPFSYPKSIHSVQDSIYVSGASASNTITMDFFAGSGTTAHAIINLNREDGGQRKYILVEANDYFHTVILPRIKKVVFSDKWKDGKAQAEGKGASHFCKYFVLEQYEDTLRRASYLNDSDSEQPAFFDNPYESPFTSYVFLRDKKMTDALTTDYEGNKIKVDFSKLYEDIDLAETLSCVKGKFIKSITAESVTFADGETVKFSELDYRDILPLVWWDR